MKKVLIYITFVFAIFASCEKEIIVDVEDAPQQLVIEGRLNNYLGESYFLISKSKTLYGGVDFEKVTGATISVTDDAGVIYTFTDDPSTPGRYILPTFQAQPNSNYNLTLIADGQTVTATSWAPSIPKIDTLTYIINPPQGFGQDDSTYFVFYTFTDDESQTNFYRIRPIINDTADNNFYIGDDQLGNGESTTAPFFATTPKVGDETDFKVVLSSFDEANYTYLFSWSNAADGSPFSAAPSNPVTNLEGDNVVGYFGAFMQDTVSLYLP